MKTEVNFSISEESKICVNIIGSVTELTSELIGRQNDGQVKSWPQTSAYEGSVAEQKIFTHIFNSTNAEELTSLLIDSTHQPSVPSV